MTTVLVAPIQVAPLPVPPIEDVPRLVADLLTAGSDRFRVKSLVPSPQFTDFTSTWTIFLDDDYARFCKKLIRAHAAGGNFREFFGEGTFGIAFDNGVDPFVEAFDDAAGSVRIQLSREEANALISRAIAVLLGKGHADE